MVDMNDYKTAVHQKKRLSNVDRQFPNSSKCLVTITVQEQPMNDGSVERSLRKPKGYQPTHKMFGGVLKFLWTQREMKRNKKAWPMAAGNWGQFSRVAEALLRASTRSRRVRRKRLLPLAVREWLPMTVASPRGDPARISWHPQSSCRRAFL
jgi:hypothetical protein